MSNKAKLFVIRRDFLAVRLFREHSVSAYNDLTPTNRVWCLLVEFKKLPFQSYVEDGDVYYVRI